MCINTVTGEKSMLDEFIGASYYCLLKERERDKETRYADDTWYDKPKTPFRKEFVFCVSACNSNQLSNTRTLHLAIVISTKPALSVYYWKNILEIFKFLKDQQLTVYINFVRD
jgi:hypothetical protein